MAEKKDKVGRAGAAAAGLVILAGLATLCYPFASNYLYTKQAGSTVEFSPGTGRDGTAESGYALQWQEAEAYNVRLAGKEQELSEPFGEAAQEREEGTEAGAAGSGGQKRAYEELLDCGDGLMCYVEIPEIRVFLPVYHGTEAEVLEKGIGHLEGSSLPVGGESSHCVLSGHTGLNKAKLFTDLTMLEAGDLFYLHTLGETLAYQTDRILVVEPEDVRELEIREGEDLVTLVTCTPYGINSHRLLVRGSRIPWQEEDYLRMEEKGKKMPRSEWMREYRAALLCAGGGGILFLTAVLIRRSRRKKARRKGKPDGRKEES